MVPIETRYPQSNLAACMLPWTEDFQLDVAKFEQHLQATLDDGYTCLYLMGTAGEGYALCEDRFRQVVEVFAANTVRDGIDPQIGVIGLSMEQITHRIALAHVRPQGLLVDVGVVADQGIGGAHARRITSPGSVRDVAPGRRLFPGLSR